MSTQDLSYWADRIETARRARDLLAEFMVWLQVPPSLEQAVKEILERRRAARRSLGLHASLDARVRTS
jgi:phage major head subunit gpT-like protein